MRVGDLTFYLLSCGRRGRCSATLNKWEGARTKLLVFPSYRPLWGAQRRSSERVLRNWVSPQSGGQD